MERNKAVDVMELKRRLLKSGLDVEELRKVYAVIRGMGSVCGTGRWLEVRGRCTGKVKLVCSNCQYSGGNRHPRFCPMCGQMNMYEKGDGGW